MGRKTKVVTTKKSMVNYLKMAKECRNIHQLISPRYMDCSITMLYKLFENYPKWGDKIRSYLNENKQKPRGVLLGDKTAQKVSRAGKIYDEKKEELNEESIKAIKEKGQRAKKKAMQAQSQLRRQLSTRTITVVVPDDKRDRARLKRRKQGNDRYTKNEKLAYTKAVIDLYLYTDKTFVECCNQINISPKALYNWRTPSSKYFEPEVKNLWDSEVEYANFLQTAVFRKRAEKVLLENLYDKTIKEIKKRGTVNADGSITPTDVVETTKTIPADHKLAFEILQSFDPNWLNKYTQHQMNQKTNDIDAAHNARYLTDAEIEAQLNSLVQDVNEIANEE